jgi:hypothetical protein
MTGGARTQKKKRKGKEDWRVWAAAAPLLGRAAPIAGRCGRWRAWAAGEPGWARLGPVGQIFFSFLFFYFCFLISFITFAYELQIKSNQFLNFSKIQHNNTKQ